MDFVTGLPPVDGCNALWVIVDQLTKMAHFVPYSDMMKPRQLADSFILHIVRTDGLPNSIVSDQGSLFTSKFWTHIMGALGMTRNLSTAFYPETDSQTERVNAIMEQYLRAYCNYQQDNWKQLLPIAEFCYNNTQSETTRVTPFYANYGYYPRFEPDLGSVSTEAPEVSEYVTALNNLHAELRAKIAYAQAAHVEQANKTCYPDPVLELGDRVWLRWKHVKTTRPSGKLDYKSIGPYTVLERVGSRAYKLDLPPSIQLHQVFHISLLEPAEPDSEPIPGHIQPPPLPVIIDNEEEWEHEEIVDSHHYRNQLQYQVKWTGFHDQDKAWYPATNFENSQDAVQQFHTRYPQKPAPRN
jgi:transposase InsO family protein